MVYKPWYNKRTDHDVAYRSRLLSKAVVNGDFIFAGPLSTNFHINCLQYLQGIITALTFFPPPRSLGFKILLFALNSITVQPYTTNCEHGL